MTRSSQLPLNNKITFIAINNTSPPAGSKPAGRTLESKVYGGFRRLPFSHAAKSVPLNSRMVKNTKFTFPSSLFFIIKAKLRFN
jgi:hypothetical protein